MCRQHEIPLRSRERQGPRLDDGSFADAALAYAARGWPVFPLAPRAKVPLIPKTEGGSGVRDASSDPDRIRAGWATQPESNIGLAAGVTFWVLDVDYKGWEATEPDGLTSLAALVERFGPLPPTVTQITGGGGYQFFFRANARLRNGVAVLPGLDTRATGGYVVAPPSVHPNGRTYRWRRGHGPGEIGIAAAPAWLIALVEPIGLPQAPLTAPARVDDLDRYGAAALDRACDTIRGALIGRQADTLDRQSYGIGRLVAGGVLPAAHARAALEHAGRQMRNQAGRRPWTAREVAWRVGRAFAQAARAPRTLGAG